MEIEIGRSKRARRVYAFDDIAIVPSRRTRDPEDVSVNWTIDAYQFSIPFLAAPMDSVVSPNTAIMMGQLGGVGVLDLEGLWTRYDDPEPLLAEIRELPANRATARMQEMYAEPIKPSLVTERLAQIRNERRPNSKYASLENCRDEIHEAEAMMRREGIRWLSTTTKSIEEIATTILQEIRPERLEY